MTGTLSAPPSRSKFARPLPEPPGPRPYYPGEYLRLLASDKLELFGPMAKHGDVTQIRIGPRRVAQLMHPDDIRRVLVTDQRSFLKGRALGRTRMLLEQPEPPVLEPLVTLRPKGGLRMPLVRRGEGHG